VSNDRRALRVRLLNTCGEVVMRESLTRAHRLALIETEAVSLLISQSLDAPRRQGRSGLARTCWSGDSVDLLSLRWSKPRAACTAPL